MRSLAVLPILASLALVSCGKEAPPPKAATSAAQPAPVAAPADKRAITANDYTGGEYVSGVSTKTGKLFYFLISNETPNPIRAGSQLTFAKSGTATVTRVDVAPQSGKTAIFVHVDKTLDPKGDGYPNPIRMN